MYIHTLKSSWLKPTNGFNELIPSPVPIRRTPPCLTPPLPEPPDEPVQLAAESERTAKVATTATRGDLMLFIDPSGLGQSDDASAVNVRKAHSEGAITYVSPHFPSAPGTSRPDSQRLLCLPSLRGHPNQSRSSIAPALHLRGACGPHHGSSPDQDDLGSDRVETLGGNRQGILPEDDDVGILPNRDGSGTFLTCHRCGPIRRMARDGLGYGNRLRSSEFGSRPRGPRNGRADPQPRVDRLVGRRRRRIRAERRSKSPLDERAQGVRTTAPFVSEPRTVRLTLGEQEHWLGYRDDPEPTHLRSTSRWAACSARCGSAPASGAASPQMS